MTGPGELNIEEAVKNALAQSLLASQALSYDNSAGTTTADYTVFDEDIAIDFNGEITIQILLNLSTNVQLKLTPAGTTTAYEGDINGGSALNANTWEEFVFNVSKGDAINFVISVPAGDTLSGLLRIFKRER